VAGAAIGANERRGEPVHVAHGVVLIDRKSDAYELIGEASNAVPEVLAAARAAARVGGTGDESGVETSFDESSGRLDIEARAPSAAAATALADSYITYTATALRRLALPDTRTPDVSFGDFENGTAAWGAVRSVFNVAPSVVGVGRRDSRYGDASLRSACGPFASCGPSIRLWRSFRPGDIYVASAWVRAARDRTPVRMVLGFDPGDVSTGRQRRLGRRWKRISAAWRPESFVTSAEVGFQTLEDERVVFDADGVALGDPGTRTFPTRADFTAGTGALDYDLVSLSATDERTGPPTVQAALIGGGLGLAVALAAVVAAWLTRRRRDRLAGGDAESPDGARSVTFG
jgi:hypothetical protein